MMGTRDPSTLTSRDYLRASLNCLPPETAPRRSAAVSAARCSPMASSWLKGAMSFTSCFTNCCYSVGCDERGR